MDDMRKAEEYWEKVLSQDPGNEEAKSHLKHSQREIFIFQRLDWIVFYRAFKTKAITAVDDRSSMSPLAPLLFPTLLRRAMQPLRRVHKVPVMGTIQQSFSPS